LHLGTARTALLAWLRARSEGGALVMRIEDLDPPRVVAGAAAAILADLRWLGLDWDEGPDVGGPHAPYVQSERSAAYEAALAQLRAIDRVYPCTCSRREIAQVSTAPHGDLGPRYPGTCRTGCSHPERAAALRFVMDAQPEGFDDVVHGRHEPVRNDDFVLKRADGLYAYQLAVVVDDIAMGITEVVRGDDLLEATPWQIALHRALGAEPPRFAHVPLVFDEDGNRLSKRQRSLAVSELRERGVGAARILGWLGSTLGIGPPTQAASSRELLERFAIERVPREPVRVASGVPFD
jgi:glutamyl-tRNA synthetase